MSSSKTKKVHYERGTKWSSKEHSRRSSGRDVDSGVGSSSASDRASLGTAPDSPSPFSTSQIEDQRHILHSVQEALDSANEKIKHLESKAQKLDQALKESNSENRSLKRERKDLLDQIDYLNEALENEKKFSDKMKHHESSPRTGTVSTPRTERRTSTTPPRQQQQEAAANLPRSILRNAHAPSNSRDEGRSQTTTTSSERDRERERERRSSFQSVQIPRYEYAPQPPTPSSPREQNPFTPISPVVPRSMPSMSYPIPGPGMMADGYAYAPAPSHVSYTSAPQYAPLPPARSEPPNDGKYHLYPL